MRWRPQQNGRPEQAAFRFASTAIHPGIPRPKKSQSFARPAFTERLQTRHGRRTSTVVLYTI
jgi:hypothetical protein